MTTTTLLHDIPVDLTVAPAGAAPASAPAAREPLFREALGMSLRAFRADKGVTLRALAKEARVSSGYISELERGRKEVSSELLAALCDALGTTVSEVLLEAVANMSLHSFTEELERTTPAAAEA
ncbi:helix-turn-helix domain-containing protein [Corynebacterium ureicelerivorans]|uniref:DNA-binding XRE family transcriptional regulator n=1 Tax=Corynebacterium mucifaciens TaxID=57171 RepID=A0A7X6LPY5_9CORY|nr:helix-turn-helix transcriptional regulator [Corynebacterium mucifaciens]NKY68151.1 helix-turn-helix transcriptional regulator [Corynebacterium mucifaciens]